MHTFSEAPQPLAHEQRSTALKQRRSAKQARSSARDPQRPASATDPVRTELASLVIGVSRDQRTALLSIGGYPGFQQPGRYRRVDIATGETVEEFAAGSLPGLPVMGLITEVERARWRAPATLGADLARIGAVWAGLTEARHHRFAASERLVMFGVGDALYAAAPRGGNVAPISRSAGYSPEFSRDGALVAWGEHVGRGDGEGIYALHVASAIDRRPRRVPGSDQVDYEGHRFSADGGTLYFTARDDARREHCFRRATIARDGSPSAAQSILCGADRKDNIEVAISPSRTMALVAIRHRTSNSAGTVDLHWIRLSDERELASHTRSGVFVMGSVMDDGLAIASVAMNTALIDPIARRQATLGALRIGPRNYSAAWRNAGELIVSTRDGIRVVRPRQLFNDAPKTPL
ncbi:MAG: hypothetical protein U0269_21615 [Polyangiales bacterium]